MTEKRNDINELAQRNRILRALGGLPSNVVPPSADSGGVPDAIDPMADDWPDDPSDDEAVIDEGEDATGERIAVDDGSLHAIEAAEEEETANAAEDLRLSRSIGWRPPTVQAHAATPTSVDVLSRYLASCASKNSRVAMHQSLDRAARIVGAPNAEAVPWPSLRFEHTDAMRSGLLQAVRDKRFRMTTVRLALTAIRGVLREAVRMGVMRSDDFGKAIDWRKLPKHERLPAGRMLPPDEIAAVWQYCVNIDGAYGAWLRAVFQLLLGTGLRATEACEMPVAGYDARGKCIRLIRKGGKEDSQPLTEYQVEMIDEWLLHRQRFAKRVTTQALLLRVNQNDWVHPHAPLCNAKILAYIFRLVSTAANVPHFSPHDLRRTFCSTGFRNGIDGSIMRRFMGHASSDTTDLYNLSGEDLKVEARAKFEVIPRLSRTR
jgi:integrase/recombinase XerD